MRRGRYDDYYDEVYGRTPPRRRRKKRGRGFLLLLVLLLALGALYMVRSGGLRVLSVPQENIETDFEVVPELSKTERGEGGFGSTGR